MAYTKTRQDADTYFKPGNHLASGLWGKLKPTEQDAGLAAARRFLERYLSRALIDPDSDASNFVQRDDYAHFEQALYFVQINPMSANAEQTGVSWKNVMANGEAADGTMEQLAPEAANWLGISQDFIVRG